MTAIYITIDTEYSSGLAARGGLDSRKENFDRSIACTTPEGPVGIDYQLDIFDRNGLKAVFFVDTMPALVWGVEAITDIVGPIIARGHEVQLHAHTEWLELAGAHNPLKGRTGGNIKDFTFEEQCQLIDYARSVLIAAGSPKPTAFRAGNYGANDDTLRALAELGFAYDSSHCPGIADTVCDISLDSRELLPLLHCGVIEVPIGCIADFGGSLRHAQLTALSSWEMQSAICHAQTTGIETFTLISHSFELLSRDRMKVNRFLKRRFENLCAEITSMKGVVAATYSSHPPAVAQDQELAQVMPLNMIRLGFRIAEQAVANGIYGRK